MEIQRIEVILNAITESNWNYLIKYGERGNTLLGEEFDGVLWMPYWFIKNDAPMLIESGDITKLFEECLRIKGSVIEKVDFSSAYAESVSFLLWFRDNLMTISKMEKKYLGGEPSAELIASGSSELDKLGAIVIINELAQGDITKFKEIKEMPYNEIFDKLRLNNITANVKKNYNEIMSKKNKKTK